MTRILWFVIAFSIVLLSGCNTTNEEATINNDETQDSTNVEVTAPSSLSESPVTAPEAQSVANSPLPTPTSEPTPVPQPEAGTGSVVGQLSWILAENPEPADAGLLYLAPVVEADDGTQALVGLDKKVNPKTITDLSGRFVFSDIEPGTYGLIFSLPGLGEVLINQQGDSDGLLITVEADQITAVEEIVSDYPF